MGCFNGIQSNSLLNSVRRVWYVRDANGYHKGSTAIRTCKYNKYVMLTGSESRKKSQKDGVTLFC